MFILNEKVVYPGHGVMYISKIIEKIISGNKITFYELAFLNRDATILVPTTNVISVGIRALSSKESINDAFRVIAQPARKLPHHEFSASSWNKRNKQYQLKLREGSLIELSEIYRDLRFIETQKELSFGEKTLLGKTEMLLAEEISLVQNKDESKTIEQLRSLCGFNKQSM